VVLLFSEGQFGLCGLIEYRNQYRCAGNRLYGWFEGARVCDISDDEVILTQPYRDFEFLGVADYSKLVASIFQRRLKFRICDQLGAMRARVLVSKNFGGTVSEQSSKTNAAAHNKQLISAAIGGHTRTSNYAYAQYGNQRTHPHRFTVGAAYSPPGCFAMMSRNS